MTQGSILCDRPSTSTVASYEDIQVGDVYRSRGRTVTEFDNIWFTCLTTNTNQILFNVPYAGRTRFKQPLVVARFTLGLIAGLTVPDASENALANLGWSEIKMPNPVFVGDTLWAQSEIIAVRELKSNPDVGLVTMRSRGINQRCKVVTEFVRTFMVYKREAASGLDLFPGTDADWTV